MRTHLGSLALAIGFAAASYAACADTAWANISSATLATAQASYVGPCPVTLKFSGAIGGSAGTTFKWAFYRNGKPAALTAGAIPSNGSLSVADAITVSASGSDFDQIYVTSITPNQPDVYSPRVNFKVSCGTPPPSPSHGIISSTVSGASKTRYVLAPPAPSDLTSTTSPGVCVDHIGADLLGLSTMLCAAAIKAGLMLVWSYSPGAYGPADGFKIYRVDGGQQTLINTMTGGTGSTGYGPGKPADGFMGKCYAVTAYKGQFESPFSNRYCIGPEVHIGTATIVLQPANRRTFTHDVTYKTGICSTSHDRTSSLNDDLEVGYDYAAYVDTPCDEGYSQWWRAGVRYDISPIAGKGISKATLSFDIEATYFEAQIAADQPKYAEQRPNEQCASRFGPANGAWWASSGDIDGDFSMPLAYNVKEVDVTQVVGGWVHGQTNNGLAFRGSNEGRSFLNMKCHTMFRNMALRVEYFP